MSPVVAFQYIPWTVYTPTFTGMGTVSGVGVRYARHGAMLLIAGTWTTGTVTAAAATMTLPIVAGVQLTGSSPQPSLIPLGRCVRNVATATTIKTMNMFLGGTDQFINFASDDYTTAKSPIDTSATNNVFVTGGTYWAFCQTFVSQWTSV